MTLPSLSIVIPQWGKTEFTAQSVAAFRRSHYEGDVQIIVWDNASPGGPGPVADRDDVTIIDSDANVGFGPAMNGMAHHANGELLVLANNDIVPAPDCLDWLVQRFTQQPSPGAVVPRYRTFDGRQLESGSYVGRDGRGWQLFHDVEVPPSLRHQPYLAHYGSAACMLVSRQAFIDGGGFDNRYAPAYYEDTDFCVANWVRGRPTVVEPRATVFHYEGGTSGRDVTTGPKALQLKHRGVFRKRWADWLDELPPISFPTALQHALTLGSPKPPILWVTPHLPRIDREAGHARIVRMLRLLKEHGHPVVVWAENCHDPDRYGVILEDLGIPWFGYVRRERWTMPSASTRTLEGLGSVLDAAPWGSVVISFPEFAERIMDFVRAQAPQAAVLIDDVDLHFLRQERAAALSMPTSDELPKDRELAVYRRSDGVITASTLETEILQRELPGLAVQTYAVAAEPPREDEPSEPSGHLLFLGNFVHPPNVDAVDWWIDELAPRVRQLAGRPVILRVVGSGSPMFADGWAARSPDVQVAGWVPSLDDELRASRVFLAPLRFGAGTKGKIASAIAHGLPTVTTSIGAEGVDRHVGSVLHVADDPDEIAAVVAQLMTDDQVWRAAIAKTIQAAKGSFEYQQALGEEFVDWVQRRSKRRKFALR